MLPLKIIDPMPKRPFVTTGLILICCLIFWKQPVFFPEPGLVPLDMLHSIIHPDSTLPGKILSLFTAFFLHGGFMHLAGNMWYLWIFGSALEQHVRRVRFFAGYMAFGVVSLAVQVAADPLSSIPIVGASGAIAGIMGMYLVIRPLSRVQLWFPPVFFFRLPAVVVLAGWFWLQWYNAGKVHGPGGGVAWWAHIGGFITGVGAGLYARISGRRRRTDNGRRAQRKSIDK